jgi:inorganic pyrophosphatase
VKNPENFWTSLKTLISVCEITIDRPKGSTHPRYPDFTYPLDYGYIENSKSSDGEGIDVWLGSQDSLTLSGLICTVDASKFDIEMKLLLGCTKEECTLIKDIHNTGHQTSFLMLNPQ